MAQPIVEVKGLVTKFGEQVVHDHLDFTLYENEILGLVGGSGAGKSVLLRTILGLMPIQEGTIHVRDGKESSNEYTRRNWGVMFQGGALFSGMTVIDNIALPIRENFKMSEDDIQQLALKKLEMVGLKADAAHKMPSQLSGGMVKRAALARAMALDPEILFLDEPTAGLDPIAAASFDELIKTLRDVFSLSVFIITHDLDTLTTLCDRIAMLVDKKITVGTLDDMMRSDHPWIREYFTGPRMRAVMQQGAHQG